MSGAAGVTVWRLHRQTHTPRWQQCPRVTWLPSRAGFDGDSAGDDTQEHRGLSERSQAVGAVLSLLLVALTGCLLTLLLYKKERR